MNSYATPGTFSDTVTGGIQQKAKDSQRQTDIIALDSHIEAYYASTGNYPTLANLNSPAWVAQDMPGLDPQAFIDPDGSAQALASTPTKNAYSYQYGSDSSFKKCDKDVAECAYFKLTAYVSDGTTYSRSSN
jgi:hypothetical protein